MPSSSSGYVPIGENHSQRLRINEDVYLDLYAYKNSLKRLFFYYIFGCMTLGLSLALCAWYPKLKRIKYKKCSLEDAQLLLVKDDHDIHRFISVYSENVHVRNQCPKLMKFFNYQHTKYVFIEEQEIFSSLDYLIPSKRIDEYLNDENGIYTYEFGYLLNLYGPNEIEVDIKPYTTLFFEEVFTPFYIFQMFSVVLWFFDEYEIYAACVLVLTLISAITSLVETRKQSVALHNLVKSSKGNDVDVLRHDNKTNNIETIKPEYLVPGDLLILPRCNFVIPCDVLLLNGQCIVNESVLTGESVPVIKTAPHPSDELYNSNLHKRHTLYAGTYMIQSRYYGGERVLARVMNTGFNTTKGDLVKSILYPTPIGLQFYKDSLKFVFVLFVIAGFGTIYCLYLYIKRGAEVKEIIFRTLDIITIVVPPALPAAMTVGIVYSQNRLKKVKIFCTSPPRINVCGKIKLACFDKTGTLTHDGLEMHSVLPCINTSFPNEPFLNLDGLSPKDRLVQAMATCHSLIQINGELTGDPLDVKMFEFTDWMLEEPGDDENARYDLLGPTVVMPRNQSENTDDFPYQIGIVRQFPFSSTLQCMSVICRVLDEPNMLVFTKGAPEKLANMCLNESLPKDYFQRLSEYTARGYRVIALAYKQCPKKFKWKDAQTINRDAIECQLHFLGFLVLQNPLKPETTPVISKLHKANIRTVMITGDNILTAISVARDCELVRQYDEVFVLEIKDEKSPRISIEKIGTKGDGDIPIDIDNDHYTFAIDGKTWDRLKEFFPEKIPYLLVRSAIFARFQPAQKAQLITYFQNLDYIVSMVGDGANDCGALKAADIGVSLSEAEASVAAPFTSSIPNISCLISLMLEGRCALVTSFAVFKYMALYSLIQFCTILVLYRQHSILGNTQFLYIDLIITTSLAVTIGRQRPSNELTSKRPLGSLVSGKNLIPLILQVLTCISVQILGLICLYQQDWFHPIPDDSAEEVVVCWENTVLFTVSCFQYITLAVVYSKGKPYRQSMITNFLFLMNVLVLTVFNFFLIVHPPKIVAELFEIIYLPHVSHEQNYFKYKLLSLPIAHFLISFIIEVCVADRRWLSKMINCLKRKKISKNKYKVLLEYDARYLFNDENSGMYC